MLGRMGMREFDAEDPLKRREMREVDDGGAGPGLVGLIAGTAIAVMVGALFWSMGDRTDRTAMNDRRPGVTTGIAPSAPPPPPFDKDDPQTRK